MMTAGARWVARQDAGLSPSERLEFETWLAADPRHRDALAFHEATWGVLGRPLATGRNTAFAAQLGKLAARRRLRRTRMGALAVAALTLFAVVTFRPKSGSIAADATASSAQILAPALQHLPDGSVAELKENSRFSVAFEPSVRRVVLHSGEAHFAVQSDPLRPFVVSVAGIEVQAIGTAFSVRKESASVEVLVTQGKVAVKRELAADVAPMADAPANATLATLEAGSVVTVELTAQPQTEVRAIDRAEQAQRLAWRGPRIEFSRTPLSEAVELFNRHASPETPRLEVTDANVAGQRISGIFRADGAEAFVSLLESAFNVRAERSDGIIRLGRGP
jgi:transmembrane sensor